MKSARLSHSRLVLSGALVAAFYLMFALGIYTGLTRYVLGANDFYSRWQGARALLLRGENPYSDAVTREIQMGMSGRLALPGEDQVAFAYPLYVAFPVAPFVTLPYAFAQAFWMALLMLAIVGGAIALFRLYRAPRRPAILSMLLLSVLIFYPSVRGIFNGQVTILSFFFIAVALWAIDAQADVAAGILLALATIKPQPPILLLPIILVWAWRQGRTKIVASALIALCILVAVAMLLVPTWLMDFLQGLHQYAAYEPIGPPIQILGEMISPGAGFLFAVVFSLVLLGWLARQAALTLDSAWGAFQSTIGLTAIVSTWMAGRMGTPDQVLLLIPWSQWLAVRLRRGEYGWAGGAGLILLLLPWLVFLATLRGNAEDPNIALVLPVVSLGAFVWETRRADRSLTERAR